MTISANLTSVAAIAMRKELVAILSEVLPSRELVENASRQILDHEGNMFLPDLLWTLTNYRCEQEEATQHWRGLLQHRHTLIQSLDRDPGLRVVALDYFTNVLGKAVRPRVAHSELLEHLFQQATSDALTGLANRRYLRARTQDELMRARRYRTSFVQLLLDIDHFKEINDSRGHDEGDRVLQRVADCIRDSVRDSDIAARWGGEEFVVLMPETTKKGGTVVAERIRSTVEAELRAEQVTVSGGLAAFPVDGDTEAALFQFADRALYQAKAAGKNRVYLTPAERRSFPRLVRQYPFQIMPVGAEQWILQSETDNVSQGGFGFRHPGLQWVAEEIRGFIDVDRQPVDFRGRIAHLEETPADEYGIGVEFTDIRDEDRLQLTSGQPS